MHMHRPAVLYEIHNTWSRDRKLKVDGTWNELMSYVILIRLWKAKYQMGQMACFGYENLEGSETFSQAISPTVNSEIFARVLWRNHYVVIWYF